MKFPIVYKQNITEVKNKYPKVQVPGLWQ